MSFWTFLVNSTQLVPNGPQYMMHALLFFCLNSLLGFFFSPFILLPIWRSAKRLSRSFAHSRLLLLIVALVCKRENWRCASCRSTLGLKKKIFFVLFWKHRVEINIVYRHTWMQSWPPPGWNKRFSITQWSDSL